MKLKLAIVFLLFASLSAEAGSVAVRIGKYTPRGESELWEDNVETFDFVVSDFNALAGGVEFTFELNEFVDLAVGIDGYSRTVGSNYRDFVRDEGTEIVQDLHLEVAPITVGLRLLPVGKFQFLLPYVAGGFGIYPYEYREEGEFIDFATFEIFEDLFLDRGVGTGTYAAAGLEVPVTRGFLFFGEFRHHWVWAEHNEDFIDFGDFDLDANQLSFGFTVRF